MYGSTGPTSGPRGKNLEKFCHFRDETEKSSKTLKLRLNNTFSFFELMLELQIWRFKYKNKTLFELATALV